MRYGVKSDKGLMRESNEDSYNIIAGYPGIPVSFVIADGMGGHNSGEIASKTAVDFISKQIMENPETFSKTEDIPSSIKSLLERANFEIFTMSMEQLSNYGMGTTVILVVVLDNKLFAGHIGDSRLYVVRNNEIKRLTTDHSYVEELVMSGSLTREEAENHPKKHVITRALGCEERVEVDVLTHDIREDDIFVLCTDGLTNMISEEEIQRIVLETDEPADACDKLVERANAEGGEDNITVIVFKYS